MRHDPANRKAQARVHHSPGGPGSLIALIAAFITAVTTGTFAAIDREDRPSPPQRTIALPPVPDEAIQGPNIARPKLKDCGTSEFRMQVDEHPLYVGESFGVELRGRAPKNGCRLTVRLQVIPTSDVTVVPQGDVTIAPSTNRTTLFRWRLASSSLTSGTVVAVLGEADGLVVGRLEEDWTLQPNRRTFAATEFLSKFLYGLDVEASTASREQLRANSRGVLRIAVRGPANKRISSGLDPLARFEMCTKVSGSGIAEAHCIRRTVQLTDRTYVEDLPTIETDRAGEMEVIVTITVVGEVDGLHEVSSSFSYYEAAGYARFTIADRISQGGSTVLVVVSSIGGAAGLVLVGAGLRRAKRRLGRKASGRTVKARRRRK